MKRGTFYPSKKEKLYFKLKSFLVYKVSGF